MSDWTPSTNRIRKAWITHRIRKSFRTAPEASQEFDRWLASVKAEAVAEFIDSTGVAPDGVRPLLAKAWDEGNAVDRRFNAPTPNPYREVSK